MHDAEGDIVSDEPACFNRTGAADALQLHFGAPVRVVASCLSASNVAEHYEDHCAAVFAVVKGARR